MSSARGRKTRVLTKGHQFTQYMNVHDHTFDGTEEDNIENVTVHQNAVLTGVQMQAMLNAVASDDQCLFELSDSGNFQGYQNDNGNTLAVCGLRMDVVTQGGANMVASITREGLAIPFRAGDRVFLNGAGTNTRLGYCSVILTWELL